MKFGCSIGIFLSSAHLICRSTDISKCFRGSLRLRDNESRLYNVCAALLMKGYLTVKQKHVLKNAYASAGGGELLSNDLVFS